MSEGSVHDPSKTTTNLLTDDRDRVLHPILFAGGDAWLYDWSARQADDGRPGADQPWHNVWHARQDGEGRYNSLRTRRG